MEAGKVAARRLELRKALYAVLQRFGHAVIRMRAGHPFAAFKVDFAAVKQHLGAFYRDRAQARANGEAVAGRRYAHAIQLRIVAAPQAQVFKLQLRTITGKNFF